MSRAPFESSITDAHSRRKPGRAFAWSIPIGTLGGLMGLGGAEFRLPVLVGAFGYNARAAVALNLAVSLVTVISALAWRSFTLSLRRSNRHAALLAAMVAGSMVAAFFAVGWAARLSLAAFTRIVMVALLAIGVLLLVESFAPVTSRGLFDSASSIGRVAAFAAGLAIGLFSSMLGVAGGELIIPTLIYGFGFDVRLAGSASLVISIPTVLVGIARYARLNAYADRADLRLTVAPMAVGSVIGTGLGALLAGIAPVGALKATLGVILIVSAIKAFRQ